jgi:serine protease Do
MRHLLALAVVALSADLVGAQSGASTRTRDKECDACARDSVLRATRKARTEHRAHIQRVTRVVHELGMVRRKLEDEHELSASERRRLELRASGLESELGQLETRLGLESAARSLEQMQPAMAEARRAMAAAMAEAAVHAGAAAMPEPMRFTGWIGITLDAPSAVQERGNDVYWRFFDHPRVVSVDPSSPADRAGIRSEDVLLAYDGQDVRGEIAMNRVLRPGRVVRVRVRRDNGVRDVPVKVAPRDRARRREWAPGVIVTPLPQRPKVPRTPDEPWTPMPPPDPGQPAAIERRHVAPSISIVRVPNGLAGAHMETITPGLGEAIGVQRGVLVISVAHGVPAHESGLRDGDVIVRVDGRDVTSFRALSRAIATADDRAVTLDVARRGKIRQVTLRW